MSTTSTPTIARPSTSIAIDAEWFERLGRRYFYAHRAFPQTIARSNRQVSLKVAAINFAHFRDQGGPNQTPCDRYGVDAEVPALFEREFLRRATPSLILDMLGEIEALHNVVLDLDPAFCWEPNVRRFMNKLRRHPDWTASPRDEECARDESAERDDRLTVGGDAHA